MLYLSTLFVSHLKIDGCLPAILGALVIAVINWVARAFVSN
jgi:uncharacterized membrane protein YvlD (DUF360 family)